MWRWSGPGAAGRPGRQRQSAPGGCGGRSGGGGGGEEGRRAQGALGFRAARGGAGQQHRAARNKPARRCRAAALPRSQASTAHSHLCLPRQHAAPKAVRLLRRLHPPRRHLHRSQGVLKGKGQGGGAPLVGHLACAIVREAGGGKHEAMPWHDFIVRGRRWLAVQLQPTAPVDLAAPPAALPRTCFGRLHERVQCALLEHVAHVHLQLQWDKPTGRGPSGRGACGGLKLAAGKACARTDARF